MQMNETQEVHLWVSVPEAGSRLYGVSPQRSYQLAADGLLPTVRFGRRLLVPIRALEALGDAAVDRAREISRDRVAGGEPARASKVPHAAV
jgi:hypothetical protein